VRMKVGAAALLRGTSARGSHLGCGQIEIEHPKFGVLFLDVQWVAVMLRPRKPGLSMCVAAAMQRNIQNATTALGMSHRVHPQPLLPVQSFQFVSTCLPSSAEMALKWLCHRHRDNGVRRCRCPPSLWRR